MKCTNGKTQDWNGKGGHPLNWIPFTITKNSNELLRNRSGIVEKMGKPSMEDLKALLNCIKKDSRVIVPPQPGFDSGVHILDGDECLVVSTDPCMGVPDEWFGWFLINYVASDIALFGAKTEFCTVNILGSPSTDQLVFQNAMKQACTAADELGIAIVTGHTGRYSGISKLVGVCSGYGRISRDKLITPGDAKPGDCILCVKPLGLETVVNFVLSHRTLARKLFGVERSQELSKLVSMQSCVKEALMLSKNNEVHAMHDATEGGATTALNEIAEASNIGFRVEWEKLPILEEAKRLKEVYNLSDVQLLSMSSTGTILAAVRSDHLNFVKTLLQQNAIEAQVMGYFTRELKRIIIKNGKETLFPSEPNDPYTTVFS